MLSRGVQKIRGFGKKGRGREERGREKEGGGKSSGGRKKAKVGRRHAEAAECGL